jgi:hypothetical protein
MTALLSLLIVEKLRVCIQIVIETTKNYKYCILGCDAAHIYEFIRHNNFFTILSSTAVE